MILIIDDDSTIRLSLGMFLKREGYEVESVAAPEEALEVVRSVTPQLILMDMNYSFRETSGQEGLELLRKIRIFAPLTPVILMTAWGSIPLAVEGMRLGAFDFVTKPWDREFLLRRIRTAIALSEEPEPQTMVAKEFNRDGIIGKSPELTKILTTVERIAPTDAPVLILGENGTGKELIANAIHKNSPRVANPFVMVNLGGISRSLFESEMFGHAKGAFTGAVSSHQGRFELADKGTIFLDEIGDLDLACQVKMLRVLQQHTFERLGESKSRKVDIRVVSATNANLSAMVAQKLFREDLFYRINLITLRMPPLRERRSDIPLLVEHFAKGVAERTGCSLPEFSSEAIRWLQQQPFPGNIRELRNAVERVMLVSTSDVITKEDFSDNWIHHEDTGGGNVAADDMTLDRMEKNVILQALEKYDGNLSQAALALGITRQALYRRMEKFGIGK